MNHRSLDELESGLATVLAAPKTAGVLKLIVGRPEAGRREILPQAQLSTIEGLVGDNWRRRGSSRTQDGLANPDQQITLMSSRAIALMATGAEQWALAGDQLFVELDLGEENLPAGTRLRIGPQAIVEVTAQPHTGCRKFGERFGLDALQFVNSRRGRHLRLRGLNGRVIVGGLVRVGEEIRKVPETR